MSEAGGSCVRKMRVPIELRADGMVTPRGALLGALPLPPALSDEEGIEAAVCAATAAAATAAGIARHCPPLPATARHCPPLYPLARHLRWREALFFVCVMRSVFASAWALVSTPHHAHACPLRPLCTCLTSAADFPSRDGAEWRRALCVRL